MKQKHTHTHKPVKKRKQVKTQLHNYTTNLRDTADDIRNDRYCKQ